MLQLMMSDIENHQRMVNELAERVANLEALSENPEVTESLQDVQNRYDRVRTRCRVRKAADSAVYIFSTILPNKHDYVKQLMQVVGLGFSFILIPSVI